MLSGKQGIVNLVHFMENVTVNGGGVILHLVDFSILKICTVYDLCVLDQSVDGRYLFIDEIFVRILPEHDSTLAGEQEKTIKTVLLFSSYACKPVDIINPSNYSELKAISLDHLNTPTLLKRLGTFS